MEKTEITKAFVKEVNNLPEDSRSFLRGYLQGCIDNEKAKAADGCGKDLQKTN